MYTVFFFNLHGHGSSPERGRGTSANIRIFIGLLLLKIQFWSTTVFLTRPFSKNFPSITHRACPKFGKFVLRLYFFVTQQTLLLNRYWGEKKIKKSIVKIRNDVIGPIQEVKYPQSFASQLTGSDRFRDIINPPSGYAAQFYVMSIITIRSPLTYLELIFRPRPGKRTVGRQESSLSV